MSVILTSDQIRKIPATNKPIPALTLCLLLALAIGCGANISPASGGLPDENPPVAPRAIVWGKADLEPTDAINKWQPTVDYLAANLGDVGIDVGEIKIAPDSETLGNWMAKGEIDLISDSFYLAMIVSDVSGAQPLAFRLKDKPNKHAVIFARAEDKLTSLSALEGKIIAFAEPDSTSGFMLPLVHLRGQGFEAVELPSMTSTAPKDQIGYFFAGDDDVVANMVLKDIVVAGAVDNETFDEFAENYPGKLVIVSQTGSISSSNPVLFRKDMDPVLAQAIKQILLEMANTEEGQEVLRGTKTASFGDVVGDLSADWESTREQYLMIKD